jgi:hypothetical protein
LVKGAGRGGRRRETGFCLPAVHTLGQASRTVSRGVVGADLRQRSQRDRFIAPTRFIDGATRLRSLRATR